MTDTTFNLENVDFSQFQNPEVPMSAEDMLKGQKRTQLNATMSEAFKQNPQQQADLNRLSKQSGMPVNAVAIDPADTEARLKLQNTNVDEILRRAPKLAEYLSDYNNASMSHDDIDNLMNIEELMGDFTLDELAPQKSEQKGYFNNLSRAIPARTSDLAGSFINVLTQTSDAMEKYFPLGGIDFRNGFPVYVSPEQLNTARAAGLKDPVKIVGEFLKETDFGYEPLATFDDVEGSFERGEYLATAGNFIRFGTEQTVASIPDMIAARAGLVPYIMARAEEMGQARNVNNGGVEGEATLTDSINALPFATVVSALERILPSRIFKDIKDNPITGEAGDKAKEIATRATEGALIETPTEMVQTAIEYVAERAGTDANIIFEELLKESLIAGAAGGYGGAVLGAGSGVVSANQQAVNQYYNDKLIKGLDASQQDLARKQLRGMEDQKKIDGVNEYSSKSKLRERDVEAFRQYVENNNPDMNVFIDADAVREYLDTYEGEETPAITLLREKVEEATALDGSLQISMADFATDFSGTPEYEALRQAMVLNSEVDSPRRVEKAKEEYDDYVAKLVAEAEENVSEYVEAQDIFEAVRSQLIDTGMVTPANAKQMALVVPAWATSYAKRNGITVQQAYDRSGLVIEGPQTGEAARLAGEEALLQAAFRDGSSVFDNVRRDFLAMFEQDADSEDVMSRISEVSPEYQRLFRAMDRDSWLGYDYPSQALNEILRPDADLTGLSTGVKQALGRLVNVSFGDQSLTEGFERPDAASFVQNATAALGNSKNGKAADIYTEEEYASMDLYTIDEGRAGFAIRDGMLLSVFKDPSSEIRGMATLVPAAIQAGANKLEAFEGALTEGYAKYGFVEVDRLTWDDEYMPDGWDVETQGRPDVVIMELQSNANTEARDEAVQELSGVRQRDGSLQQRTGAGRGEVSPLQDAPSVEGVNGPIEGIVNVAEQYALDNGIPLARQSEYVDVDPEFATRVADAYEQMENAPNDPAVREAYENLIAQTMAQYQALVDAGYQFWFVDLSNDANLEYISSPWNSMRDLSQNQQMGVFPTEEGFGTDEAFDPSKNPLLADTGIEWPSGSLDGPMKKVYANDLFRAVHDAFGHGMEGAGFRARGEENAWQAHVRLFTGSAIGAITSETRGQNSWVNYGPSGEQNRTASAEDTVFADQKVGLMPEWTWTENRAPDENITDATNTAQRMRRAEALGFDTTTVYYHGTSADITRFRSSEGGKLGRGVYLSDSPAVGSRYANVSDIITRKQGNQNVIPVYIRMNNPMVYPNPEAAPIRIDANKLIEQGYDGIIVRRALMDPSMPENASEVVVFNPENIRSVNASFDDGESDFILAQSASIMRGEEDLSDFGVDKNQSIPKAREAALAFDKRQKAKYGGIDPKDYSEEAIEKIAGFMKEEIEFEMQNPRDSGLFWYSKKFPIALDLLGELFPELKTDTGARGLMTAITAITSDGQEVKDNLRIAVEIYEQYKQTGKIFQGATGSRRDNSGKLAELQELFDTMGDQEALAWLMDTSTVKDLKAQFKERTGKTLSVGYPVDMQVNNSVLLLGDKLGAFFANLMGEGNDIITMDMWWMRSINRMRGNLTPVPIGMKGDEWANKEKTRKKGLANLKELIGKPRMSDEVALEHVIKHHKAFKARNFKKTGDKKQDEIESAANSIHKRVYTEINEKPAGAAERVFMLDISRSVQDKLAQDGVEMDLADIQAVMWYYEKKLWKEVGVRPKGKISYEEAATDYIEKRTGVRPTGPSTSSGLEDTDSLLRQAQVNSVGLYSGVEGAVLDMNLPEWNGNGVATGKQVWQKLKKMEGVKAEELQWIGIEEFLLSSESKLSREAVANYVRANGVVVEEVRAEGEGLGQPFWESSEGEEGRSYSAIHRDFEIEVIDRGYGIFSIFFEGGFVNDMSSLDDAKAELRRIVADEAGMRDFGDDSDTPQWGEYVTEGGSSNYRELKLKLPQVEGSFVAGDHFSDSNIVAFLRVTDRPDARGGTNKVDVVAEITKEEERGRTVYTKTFKDAGSNTTIGKAVLVDDRNDFVNAGETPLQQKNRDIFFERNYSMFEKRELEGYQLTGGYQLNLEGEVVSRESSTPSVYFLEELQSDWHQQGRQHGYAPDSPNANAVPDAPFKGNSWLTLGLKRALVDAVDSGKSTFSWADAEVLTDRWSEGSRNLFEMQYNTKMPSIIKKLTKQQPVHLNLDAGPYIEGQKGYWTIDLTPELIEKIKADSYPMFQNQGVTRGFYSASESLIRLTEAADQTTFMHEFAHFMYEMELTSHKSDPQGNNHINAIHGWFKRNGADVLKEAADYAPNTTITQRHLEAYLDNGTTGDRERDDAIRRAVHEQFARGFEKYLMEGVAPSIELRNAFRTFARWMVQAYSAVKGMFNPSNIKLDNDIRQIYDRLLATDEQISAAEARAQYTPMFTDAAMAGMTDEEFEKYKRQQEKVKEKQTETLRDKVIKQLTRQTKSWWKEELQDEVDAQTDILEAQKVYKARTALKDGEVKMDHATVKELVGETTTNVRGITSTRVPAKLRNMTVTGGDGVHPDEAAALLGYDSGAQMIDAIMKAKPIAEVATEQAESVMKERHGDILTDGTIEAEADAAILNAERGVLILQELRALSKGTRTPTIDRQQFKFLAESNIAKLNFRNINPAKYRKAEIKAAQESAVALAAGDREGAKLAKTRQAMNFFLNKAATEARADTMRMVDNMSRYNKKAVRERIMKAENGYWEQLVKILNRFEFRKSVSMATVSKNNQAIEAWMNERIEADGDGLLLSPEVLDEVFTTHWKNVPYGSLKGITDSVKNIEHVARYSDQMKVQGEAIEFKKLVRKWVDHINANNTKGEKFNAQRTDVVEGRSWGRYVMAQMTKIPFMASWMDGGERGGLSFDILAQPFTDAYSLEAQMWEEAGQPVMDLIEGRSKADLKRHARKNFFPELVDENNNGNLYGNQIIAVALNVGNEGNLRKMLLGEGWANIDDPESVSIDNPKLQAVLSRMTESDWRLVQGIWDQMELLYPQLAEVHRRTTGLTPPKVQAVPIETPYGTFKGGYFPVKYDPNRSQKAMDNENKLNAQTESMFSTTSSIQASVTAGSTNERTKFFAPVRLSLDVVPAHFQETIHFITHHDAVRQVNKLIRNPEVAKAIRESLGPEEFKQLAPWLNDVAKDGRESPNKQWYEDVMSRLRFGVTLGSMGFSASTGIMQFLGLSNIAAEVGPAYTYKAMRQILGSPKTMSDAWDFASSNSKILNTRMTSMDREIKNAMKRINSVSISTGRPVRDAFNKFDNSNTLNAVQEASMKHIGYIQTYTVDLPTWYATYMKEMDNSGDEQKAFRVADFMVESLQGSGITKDLPAMLRSGNETHRMFTMFMTFFSSLWNLNRDLAKGARSGIYSPTTVAAKIMFLYTLPVAIEMVVRGEFDSEDEEPEEKLQKYLLKTALYPVASVPFFRDVAQGAVGEFGYTMTPLAGIIERGTASVPELLTRPLTDEDITKGQVKGATTLVGNLLGIPATGQIWKTSEHLYKVLAEGEELTVREALLGPDREER